MFFGIASGIEKINAGVRTDTNRSIVLLRGCAKKQKCHASAFTN